MKLFTTLLLTLSVSLGFAQNGKILLKREIDLSKTPIWKKIAKDSVLLPEYAHLSKLNFYAIKYQSDSVRVPGLIIEPKQAGTYPVVIFNRGGNRDYSQLTIGALLVATSKLAAEGYVIMGSNYRKEDEFGGAEVNDVLNLLQTANYVEKADTSRIGMFGWSRGGMMTYLALQKSDRIKTAIVGNGVADLFASAKDRPEMEKKVYAECIPNYWKNREAELRKRSALYWAHELNKTSSLLILSGTEDKRVNPEQAERMAAKLQELNYTFEHKKYKTNHFFTGKRKELNEVVIDWFNTHLR
jgi:dipeptidyl aminopeptidase/acylaminoacyl peptidase